MSYRVRDDEPAFEPDDDSARPSGEPLAASRAVGAVDGPLAQTGASGDPAALQAMVLAELERSGGLVVEALERVGVPYSTHKMWCRCNPDYLRSIMENEEFNRERMLARLLHVHNEISDPRRAAVASRNAQWALSKLDPERFGDKIKVEDSGADLTAILRAAVERIPRQPQPVAKLIEAQATVVESDDDALARMLS